MAQQSEHHELDWKRRVYPILDLQGAASKLRENERSQVPETVPGSTLPVTRFDMIRLEASIPCQDNFTFESADVGNGNIWQFWGVFDGHAGWQTSTVLRRSLVSYVVRELRELFATDASAEDSSIDAAIKKAFLCLDDDIIQGGLKALNEASGPRSELIADITPCFHGSMAVLAAYDPVSATLRLANVGDSDAILGRRHDDPTPNGTWTAVPIAISHSLAANKAEREKLIAEHPNEENLIVDDRVLGLPVSRAFGDHRWKWPAEAIDKASKTCYGPEKRTNYLSPPYLKAEPEITTTKVQPGEFVVLATDGLWDSMSHENAVECLRLWIEETNRRVAAGQPPLDGTPGPERTESVALEGMEDLKTQLGHTWSWTFRPEDVVVEDGNAASHLVRNVLGGKRREQFTTVMGVPAFTTYDARDDVTIQVLFFGDVLKHAD